MSRIDEIANMVSASGVLVRASSAERKKRNKERKAVTMKHAPWDIGATGPANRARLAEEPATDIDPETGRETPNPNGIRRQRRQSWVTIYAAKGRITREQQAAAEKLRNAADGMRDRDPLAALAGEVRAAPDACDAAAARLDARRFYWQLRDAIPPASRPVIERVVVDDLPIWGGNSAQRERHMQRLRDGLDAIA